MQCCCWYTDAAALLLLKCWCCWCTVAANVLLLLMRWCCWCCWCCWYCLSGQPGLRTSSRRVLSTTQSKLNADFAERRATPSFLIITTLCPNFFKIELSSPNHLYLSFLFHASLRNTERAWLRMSITLDANIAMPYIARPYAHGSCEPPIFCSALSTVKWHIANDF